VELLLAATVIAILAGAVVPQATLVIERSRAWGAARYVAARVALARSQAISRSAYVALRFDGPASETAFGVFVDGNGNGVRTDDIERRIDRPLENAVRLTDLFPGVSVTATSRLFSFSPSGPATPGTIYVNGRDGSELAVRIFGVTGRMRLLRYNPRRGTWIEARF
jgi:Tfp pilus assembly protein FimT